jgi:hypothetical protein
VQALLSLQSAGVAQQPGIGVFTQMPGVPPDVSQVSVVQALPSLHTATVVQARASWVCPVGSLSDVPQEATAAAPTSAKRLALVFLIQGFVVIFPSFPTHSRAPSVTADLWATGPARCTRRSAESSCWCRRRNAAQREPAQAAPSPAPPARPRMRKSACLVTSLTQLEQCGERPDAAQETDRPGRILWHTSTQRGDS